MDFREEGDGASRVNLSVIIKGCCLLPLMEQKLALARYFVTRHFLKNTR